MDAPLRAVKRGASIIRILLILNRVGQPQRNGSANRPSSLSPRMLNQLVVPCIIPRPSGCPSRSSRRTLRAADPEVGGISPGPPTVR